MFNWYQLDRLQSISNNLISSHLESLAYCISATFANAISWIRQFNNRQAGKTKMTLFKPIANVSITLLFHSTGCGRNKYRKSFFTSIKWFLKSALSQIVDTFTMCLSHFRWWWSAVTLIYNELETNGTSNSMCHNLSFVHLIRVHFLSHILWLTKKTFSILYYMQII